MSSSEQSGHEVCLLLGSNIEPERNLPRAIELLRLQVTMVRSSSVWQTPSIGSPGPDYLNLAMLISTRMEADALKEMVLRPLEARLGRVRTADKYAPRPIDLDIIAFDGQLLDADLFHYAHRAVPVSELLPKLRSPEGIPLEKVAAELARTSPIQQRSGLIFEL
jgi:2-amino-4-hydroxy-6-hydroxymethyldihydropteridine diphosphokinase